MSFELIFTSAPKGLKPGSRGFTSVAFTEGMPANYVQICESLSGYVHRYELSDQNYEQNPIAYSHLVGNLGGRTFSILSRVAAYGADYTGRTNKLAHHLMIGFEERVAGGPAHAMKNGAAFISKWNEDPRFLAPNRIRLQAAEPASLKAKRWEAAIGDAGVAGMLAQAFLDAPDRPAFIVYEPGMDLLPLIAEAQALLPEARRWDVTFSTYFTALPVGMKCAWRCCLPDSDALVTARRTPGALVINLIDKTITGSPSDQSLAEVARTGIPKAKEATIPSPSPQETEAHPVLTRPTPEAKKAPLRRPLISPDYGKVLKPKPPPQKKKSSPLAQITIFASLLVLFGVGTFFVSDWLEKRKHSPRDPEPQPVEEAIRKEEIQAQVADEPLEKPSELTQEKVASPQPDPREGPKLTPMQEAKPKDKAITLRHYDEVVTYDAPLSITIWDVNAIEITNSSARPAIDGGSLYGPIRYQSGKFSSIPSNVGFIRAEYPAEQVILLVNPVQARFQPLSTNVIFPQGEGGELLKTWIGGRTNTISANLFRGGAGFKAEVPGRESMRIVLLADQIDSWNKPVKEAEGRLQYLRNQLEAAKQRIQEIEDIWKQLGEQYAAADKETDKKAKADKSQSVIRGYGKYVNQVRQIIRQREALVKPPQQPKSKSLNALLALENQREHEEFDRQNLSLRDAEFTARKFAEALSSLSQDIEGEVSQNNIKQAELALTRAQESGPPTKAEILLDGRVIVEATTK